MVKGEDGARGRSITVPGPAMVGYHEKPPSVLTSVKMSKKLSQSLSVPLALIVVRPAGVSDYWLMLAMMLAGVGFGFFQTPNNRVLIGSAPRNRAGALGGLQATTRVFGQTFGGAVVASVFALGFGVGPELGLIVAIMFALVAVTVNVIRYRQANATPQEG